MNLRNALFPLIVIVLLVYLASQTLMGEGQEETRLPYSEVQRLAFSHPERVEELTFRPNQHEVVLKLTNGTTIKADYPRGATRPAFEPPMAEGAARDSKDTGSLWTRWPMLTSMFPFVLLFFFLIYLGNRRQSRISNEDLRAS